ncbi:MAG: phosphotransferase, partial [Rhodoluna sp.]
AHLPEFQPEEILRARTAELDRFAATGKVPAILLSRWEGVLEDVGMFRFQPTVVHGALNGDTVLEEDGRSVAGVLAWSSLKISDPAEDLAWILGSENDPLADAVLAAYVANRPGADATLRQRAVLYSEYERARWLMHGVNKGDQSIIDDAVEMLETLAQDVEAGAIGRLTAAPISTFSEPADFDSIAVEETSFEVISLEGNLASLEAEEEFEIIEINEDSEDSEEVSTHAVDDKTKPIELPEKSDNELF